MDLFTFFNVLIAGFSSKDFFIWNFHLFLKYVFNTIKNYKKSLDENIPSNFLHIRAKETTMTP